MRFPAALACLLLAACAGVPAAPTLSRAEALQLDDAGLESRVLAALPDLLVTDRAVAGTDAPLASVGFWTRPRAARRPGLCASSRLFVEYERAGPTRGAATAMRPASLRAFPRYRFLAAPAAPVPQALSEPEWETASARCRGLDPRRHRFFAARDDQVANEGMWLLHAALDQARSGRPPFSLRCDGPEPMSEADCLNLLRGLDPDRVWRVRGCEAPAPAGRECLTIEADGALEARILFDPAAPGMDISGFELVEVVEVDPTPPEVGVTGP